MTDYRNFAVFAYSIETAVMTYGFTFVIGFCVVENCFWDCGTRYSCKEHSKCRTVYSVQKLGKEISLFIIVTNEPNVNIFLNSSLKCPYFVNLNVQTSSGTYPVSCSIGPEVLSWV